jgi:hypothetical protein
MNKMADNKCLLCKEGKLYHIKSHLTPAGITENTYGERNKELIYTIDSEQKTIDKYFGPQYPQTESTEIKNAPNSRKDIFCKFCEAKFGNYESVVQKKLKESINSLGRGGYKINKTKEGIKYVDLDIHQNILLTYFQSIVWRQCVEQILNYKDNPLSEVELELLRETVYKNVSTTIKDITKADLSNNPQASIFTTYNTAMPNVSSFANPSPVDTNPLLFFIGAINLLYWKSKNASADFSGKTKMPDALLSDQLLLDKPRIAILSKGDWIKINFVLAKSVARKFNS